MSSIRCTAKQNPHTSQRLDYDNALIGSNDTHNLLASARFEQRMTPLQAFCSQTIASPSRHCLWDLGYFGDVKRMFFMHQEQFNFTSTLPKYRPSRLHVQDKPLQDALAQHYTHHASTVDFSAALAS
jgi:hypothetical protein